MKRALLALLIAVVTVTAGAASTSGRTLTDRELWNVCGATGGWCKIEDSSCNVSVYTCASYGSTSCVYQGTPSIEDQGGGAPWWRCGSVEFASNCQENVGGQGLQPCREYWECKWVIDGYDSGGNPYGHCEKATSSPTGTNLSYESSQVVGDLCP